MDLEIFECISEVLDEYESKKDIYKLIAEEVKDFFEKNVFSESKHELSLIYRVKSAASIREKMIRNNYDIQKNEAEKILARMQDIIGHIDETELNAVVIDILGDKGRIEYQMSSPLIDEIGSQEDTIPDLPSLMKTLK